MLLCEEIGARETGVAQYFAQEAWADHIVQWHRCGWALRVPQTHVAADRADRHIAQTLKSFDELASGHARNARHTSKGDDVHTDVEE